MKQALVLLSACLLSHVGFAAPVDKTASSSRLHIDGKTQIPDAVLPAGDYVIRIVDHLSDRVIIEVHSASGTDQKFLGVPARDISSSTPGPILVKGAHNASALRGFAFSKSNVIEFAYPKSDAVAIAKASGVKMLAIDPASDGLSSTAGFENAAGLSSDQMKIVTLWLLTPTTVGSDQPSIAAAKYHSDAPQPIQIAETHKPVISRLPKTASQLPLLLLTALVSLSVGIALTLRRIRAVSI
jgi:hypothetical protein